MTQKTKSKKIFLRLLALMVAVVFVLTCSFAIYYFALTAPVGLNTHALALAGENNIAVFSADGKKIEAKFNTPRKVEIENIPNITKQAFISMEDKKFYRHNGIDLLRIGGAIINNLKAGKVKQGGSTISQQLVKNSQLSHEKTLNRKLKEIKLTRDLERKYSKDEILEMYLNTIYFGNGCYGIGDASAFYFDKDVSELTLNESAMLVAVINAPSVYNPTCNLEKCTARKNLVLKNMLNDGVISAEQYGFCVAEPLEIVATNGANAYSQAVIDEACEKLGVNQNALINLNLKIYTYLDTSLQNQAEAVLATGDFTPLSNGNKPNATTMVIDNQTHGVVALASTSNNPLNEFHQPGSVIKPILVYAPALENNVITPVTKIEDAPIDIAGFSPQNANKTFMGYVPVKTAVSKSLNVPAVKVLQWTGVEKAKAVAQKLGINFAETDNNLALALGAMASGVKIDEIANAYSAFASGGNYQKAQFIERIENQSGEIVYARKQESYPAIKSSTAYLITDILKDVAKNGTASRLKNFNFDVSAKTGTVGHPGDGSNIGAWSVAYTTNHTLTTFIGTDNNNHTMPASVNGSTYPTLLNSSLLEHLYSQNTPQNFARPETVTQADIDLNLYSQNIVKLAPDNELLRYKQTCIFDKDNLPPMQENTPQPTPQISVKIVNNRPQISLLSNENNDFYIYRNGLVIGEISATTAPIFVDHTAPKGRVVTYYVKQKNGSTQSAPSPSVRIYLPTN